MTDGAKGDKGDNTYLWIKYASQEPTESSHSIGDLPDSWIGIYYGPVSTAPEDWKQYSWFKIKGEKGDTGNPATLVSAAVTYQVSDSGNIIPSGTWGTSIPVVAQGKYLWTKIVQTFNTGNPVTAYTVSRMGLDGLGSVVSVCGISPDENGNVPLTAAAVGALPSAGGDMTGPINMNGQALTGLNAPAKDSDAVNLGTLNAAVRKAAPRNLLDNSDFRNPVNQRGRTTLTGAIWDFIVDRWYISLDDGETAELTANGLSFSGDYHLQQRFVKGYLRSNAVYTSAIYYSDGSVELSNAPYLGESDFDYLSVSIKGNKTVACIALYEGEYTAKTLPDYQPKEYGVELAACMQYHYRSWTGTMNANGVLTRNAFNSSRMTSIDLPCAMRTTPTITIYADDGEINAVKKYVDGTKVAGVSVVYANNKSFIPAQQNGGFIAGAVYCFHYEASAEL